MFTFHSTFSYIQPLCLRDREERRGQTVRVYEIFQYDEYPNDIRNKVVGLKSINRQIMDTNIRLKYKIVSPQKRTTESVQNRSLLLKRGIVIEFCQSGEKFFRYFVFEIHIVSHKQNISLQRKDKKIFYSNFFFRVCLRQSSLSPFIKVLPYPLI